jgi:hypothetical protein
VHFVPTRCGYRNDPSVRHAWLVCGQLLLPHLFSKFCEHPGTRLPLLLHSCCSLIPHASLEILLLFHSNMVPGVLFQLNAEGLWHAWGLAACAWPVLQFGCMFCERSRPAAAIHSSHGHHLIVTVPANRASGFCACGLLLCAARRRQQQQTQRS